MYQPRYKKIEPLLNKKTLTITMSDNSQWEIPVAIIVLHRAEDQAKEHLKDSDDFVKGYYEEEKKAIELFNKDESALINWISTFVKWDDIKEYATKIEKELNFNHEWLNSAKELS